MVLPRACSKSLVRSNSKLLQASSSRLMGWIPISSKNSPWKSWRWTTLRGQHRRQARWSAQRGTESIWCSFALWILQRPSSQITILTNSVRYKRPRWCEIRRMTSIWEKWRIRLSRTRSVSEMSFKWCKSSRIQVCSCSLVILLIKIMKRSKIWGWMWTWRILWSKILVTKIQGLDFQRMGRSAVDISSIARASSLYLLHNKRTSLKKFCSTRLSNTSRTTHQNRGAGSRHHSLSNWTSRGSNPLKMPHSSTMMARAPCKAPSWEVQARSEARATSQQRPRVSPKLRILGAIRAPPLLPKADQQKARRTEFQTARWILLT